MLQTAVGIKPSFFQYKYLKCLPIAISIKALVIEVLLRI